jgi:Zn-dependent alcohol dehydrogenase
MSCECGTGSKFAPGTRGKRFIRFVSSGVCCSDLSIMNGTIPFETPVVLGDQSAEVVEHVGAGVTSIAQGDHVVPSTLGELWNVRPSSSMVLYPEGRN